MSGLVLPLPEPPHEDVAALNELIVAAQHELGEAQLRLAFVRDLNERAQFAPPIGSELMRRRVMTRVREVAVAAWSEELEALQQRARALGLQP